MRLLTYPLLLPKLYHNKEGLHDNQTDEWENDVKSLQGCVTICNKCTPVQRHTHLFAFRLHGFKQSV